MQLSLELSAQANQLAIHQHQLARLTTLTDDLVRTLQGLSLSPPEPAAAPISVPVDIATNSPPSVSPRLALPHKFNGEPTKCKGFLLQCSLFINQQPALYPKDSSKISFVGSLLTGKDLEWVTAVWRMDGLVFPSFYIFLQRFKEVFEHSSGGKSTGEQLFTLSQGKGTAADYAVTFRTLFAQTEWV